MKIQLKTIIRIAVLVLLAALVGFGIYSMNASMLGGNALPMPFGFGMTVVLSGSMEPALSVDDLLIVTPEDDYKVGDIVVFQTQRTAIVHRIISIDGEVITTRGDANTGDDEPITKANIKGRVALAIPLVGILINFIKSPVGTLLLIGAAIWLLEASFKKEKEQRSDELDAIRREIEELKKDTLTTHGPTPQEQPPNTPETDTINNKEEN